jgi:hypothetical protein
MDGTSPICAKLNETQGTNIKVEKWENLTDAPDFPCTEQSLRSQIAEKPQHTIFLFLMPFLSVLT